MEQELREAKTMAEILAICSKYYDLNEPLGIASRAMVTQGVKHVLKIIKAKPKNEKS
jgi:hypothetical protein